MFTKSASFHGTFLRAPVRGGGPAYYGVYKKALEEIRDWVEAGEIKAPAITDMGVMNAENVARPTRSWKGATCAASWSCALANRGGPGGGRHGGDRTSHEA